MPKITIFGQAGQLLSQTDDRSLSDAKIEAMARVMGQIEAALGALDDNPTREAAQWLALGMLQANAGVAFASWPAGQRTIWNNQVQPNVDAAVALRTRVIAARAAVAAATTVAQADAVVL